MDDCVASPVVAPSIVYAFIDCEYCYTCAQREDLVPNYTNLLSLLDNNFSRCIKVAYHAGERGSKIGVSDFLIRIGVNYNVILDQGNKKTIPSHRQRASKTQLIGASMAIDVMKCWRKMNFNTKAHFVFVSGDDYLVPIIEELSHVGVGIHILHWPLILSYALDPFIAEKKAILITLNNRYFTAPKKKEV